jgi:hypothetical protein
MRAIVEARTKEKHYLYRNYSTLNLPPDLLMITLGLWIQEKLLGNASLVLGVIKMFSTVPIMHPKSLAVEPRECLVEL